MHQKTDELVERVSATASAVSKLNVDVGSLYEGPRLEAGGTWRIGRDGMAAAALASPLPLIMSISGASCGEGTLNA